MIKLIFATCLLAYTWAALHKVAEISDDDFQEQIMESEDIWMVELYDPLEKKSREFQELWQQVADEFGDRISFGKIDIGLNPMLFEKYSIHKWKKQHGLPIVMFWNHGPKPEKFVGGYDRPLTLDHFQIFCKKMIKKADLPPVKHELVAQYVFDEHCTGMKICVIAILPNIYESSAEQRNSYLSSIEQVQRANEELPQVFFWLQSGDQLDLERNLGLGFGFPAVIAVSPQKQLYATMKSAFSQETLSKFLTQVMTGSVSFDPLPKQGFKVKKASKWDGKDAAPIIEDLYDDL